jgi:hypothetical protein
MSRNLLQAKYKTLSHSHGDNLFISAVKSLCSVLESGSSPIPLIELVFVLRSTAQLIAYWLGGVKDLVRSRESHFLFSRA